ncbi:MAG TPA: helix-turn-helix transcriptional regulator [Solirubrobacterales bacterium]|nr:helix-turn-helix transcriptional regulator [Solirubrobacterales bacterium]
MEIAERFGENMLIARRRSKVSQEELGFRAGLHRTEIGQLERGTRLPRIDTLIKLAGALDLPPGDLLKGMAWKVSGPPKGRFIVREEIG